MEASKNRNTLAGGTSDEEKIGKKKIKKAREDQARGTSRWKKRKIR